MSNQIPILDLRRFTSERDCFVKELGKGFEEFGFIGITNHNVSDEIIENAYGVFKDFFDLPSEIKENYVYEGSAGQRGFTPFGVEHAKDNPYMDLKEFWHVGRELKPGSPGADKMESNLWVNEIPEFKTHAYNLYKALDELGNTLLRAIALHLNQPEDFFVNRTQYGNSILRAIHYPPVQNLNTESIRAGEHEDINFITLLIGSNEPGLEILSRQGEWIPVTVIENTIVCNIADMMQRLTNHVLRSTTHRVVNPPSSLKTTSRYSIPFFLHPNPDCLLKTLDTCISEEQPNRYPEPIYADDFLKQRLHEIGLM